MKYFLIFNVFFPLLDEGGEGDKKLKTLQSFPET